MGSTLSHYYSIGNNNELPMAHPAGDSNNENKEAGNKRNETDDGEGNECNLNISFICPICMDAIWVNKGKHHICCLPCGHIYGMSCIKQWLRRTRGSGTCPQCNKTCSLNDVRKFYVTVVVAVGEEYDKRIESLEAKFASLNQRITSLDEAKSVVLDQHKRITSLEAKSASLDQLKDTLEKNLKEHEHELRDLRVLVGEQIDNLKQDVDSDRLSKSTFKNCCFILALVYIVIFLATKVLKWG